MAKKKKKPSAIKKFAETEKRLFLRHKIIGTVLVILAGWILVWLAQVGIERYNFYRVEKTMDKINADIVSKFNVVSSSKDRSCGNRNETFGEHLGGCSVSYSYKIKAPEDQKKTARAIDLVVQNRNNVRLRNMGPGLSAIDFQPINTFKNDVSSYTSDYYLDGVKNPNCEINYNFAIKDSGSIYVLFSCTLAGDAKYPYFPVKN